MQGEARTGQPSIQHPEGKIHPTPQVHVGLSLEGDERLFQDKAPRCPLSTSLGAGWGRWQHCGARGQFGSR